MYLNTENEVARSMLSKARVQTGQTNTKTHTHTHTHTLWFVVRRCTRKIEPNQTVPNGRR